MEVYASKGIKMVSKSELPHLLAMEIVAAGFAKHVSKNVDPSSRILSLHECLQISNTLENSEKKHLENILENTFGMPKTRVIHNHVHIVKAIIKKVSNPEKTLFVSVGSTPDKLGMILEHIGFKVIYVPFSRTFWNKRSGSLDSINSKLKQDFKKLVYTPIANAFVKTRAEQIAILDFVDSGNSLITMFTLLKQADESLMDRIFPIAVVDETYGKTEIAVQLVRMIPGSLFIHVEFDFWKFSKMTRCVPRVEGNKIIPLTKIGKCICNTARLFVCVFILSKIEKEMRK